MRKVFLVFGIVAFTSAAAQEKDVFDIDCYLQQKSTKLIIPICPGPDAVYESTLLDYDAFPFLVPGHYYKVPERKIVIVTEKYTIPCVKPDMRLFRTMPNPGIGTLPHYLSSVPQPGQIPNGAIPFRPYIVSK